MTTNKAGETVRTKTNTLFTIVVQLFMMFSIGLGYKNDYSAGLLQRLV